MPTLGPTTELSTQQKKRFRWSTRISLIGIAICAVFAIPVMVCAYVFNIVYPYNVGDAPLWAYVIFYSWQWGTLGPLVVAAFLASIRCPTCHRFMFLVKPPRAKTAVPNEFAIFCAYRSQRISCSRCGHGYSLA